jgi:hypothetical protein
MSFVAAAVTGGVVAAGYFAGEAQKEAAKEAGQAQTAAAQAGIEEQRRQFDAVRELLAPYTEAGTTALGAQQALLGLAGPQAQQEAISKLETSPAFAALTQQGESALLQRASATGGLRGGNIQAALGQFRPQLLANLIQQQYENLGGITTGGRQAAGVIGAGGLQTGQSIADLLAQQGAAQAGTRLGVGQATASQLNLIPQAVGIFGGLGGFGGGFGAAPTGSTPGRPVTRSEFGAF